MSDSIWNSVFKTVCDAAFSCVSLIVNVTGAAVGYFIFCAIISALFAGVVRRLVTNSGAAFGSQIRNGVRRGAEKYKKSVKGDNS